LQDSKYFHKKSEENSWDLYLKYRQKQHCVFSLGFDETKTQRSDRFQLWRSV